MSRDRTETGARPVRVVRPTADGRTESASGLKPLVSWLSSPAADFYLVLVSGALLILMGLMMVLSSSSVSNIEKGNSGYAGLFTQGVFALVGLVPLIVAAVLPVTFYRRISGLALVGALLLQALVFTPLGVSVNGNRNWIDVGFRIQPSEILKLALCLWLGLALSTDRRHLNTFKRVMLPVVPVAAISVVAVLVGHDLGTTLVLVMLIAGALWVGGVPGRYFAAGGVLATAGILAMVVTSSNRIQRITSWLSDDCDASDGCYQASHGLMGLAEGGWWGVGLGESRQKWGLLPHAENDYIFAIIGEELGLLGTLSILLLFAALAVACVRIVRRSKDVYVQVATTGIVCWLIGQAGINIAVVTGTLPVIGVPLPFVSAGGSALVICMTALGVLLSFARSEPGAQEAITARLTTLRTSFTVLPGGRGAKARNRGRSSTRRNGQ